MYNYPVKSNGNTPKRPKPKTPVELLVEDLSTTIKKANETIKEVSKTAEEIKLDTEKKTEELKQEAIQIIKGIQPEKGEKGEPGESIKGEDGISAEPLDPEEIVQEVISRLPEAPKWPINDVVEKVVSQLPPPPKVDLKKLKTDILKALPEKKGSLKIITEKIDHQEIIDKVLNDKRFKDTQIEGLEEKVKTFWDRYPRGYLHGGGDTVKAGTNISITTNVNGQKVISSTLPVLAGVTSLNALTGAITLAAGTGITISPTGNIITISATSSGVSSFTSPNSTLTVGGTTNITADINLAHANIWTANQQFPRIGINKSALSGIGIDLLNTSGGQGLRIENPASSDIAFSSFVTGDAQVRFTFLGNGQLNWGSGSAVADTFLYRSGVGTLKTDGTFTIGGGTLNVGSSVGTINLGPSQIYHDATGLVLIDGFGRWAINASGLGDMVFDSNLIFSDGAGNLFTQSIFSATIGTKKAVATDVNGSFVGSSTTDTELGYVHGVTSAIQTQLDGKQPLDSTLTALAAYNTNGLLTQTAADTFVGRTLTGTTNRISITNGNGVSGNPTVDISSSYIGQNTITTLGTITTGIWNGTAIANANLANSTISGISLGNSLNALTATNATLAFSGSYNGSTAQTVGLNLTNPNTWTGLQTFNASIVTNGYVSVASDQSTTSATMANLTDLSVTVVKKKYTGVMVLYANDSVTTEGLALDFNGGSASITGIWFGFTGTPIGATLGTTSSTSAGTAITITSVGAGDNIYHIPFVVEFSGAGTFIPRFSQVTHVAGTAIVRKYSYIKMDITN